MLADFPASGKTYKFIRQVSENQREAIRFASFLDTRTHYNMVQESKAPTLPASVFDMFSMKGKVVIVTGGSGGIGYHVGRAMAEAGADVALWYNSSKKTHEMAEDVARTYGVKCRAYQCSVADADAVWATVAQVVADFGRLDVMIANAGIPATAPALKQPLSDWHKVMDTDLNGAYYCAKAAGEIFEKQGSGNLIFTASMSGHIVNVPQLQSSYNAAKAAIIHLAKSLAVEWAGFARVNSVSPGYISTDISSFAPEEVKQKWLEYIPLCREALPEELKGAYLYLASNASTYTTGTDIVVDGGYCCR